MSIIIQRPWTRQPPAGVQINRQHPLAKKFDTFVNFNGPGGLRNLITQSEAVTSTVAGFSPTIGGVGVTSTGSGRVALNQVGNYTSGSFFLAFQLAPSSLSDGVLIYKGPYGGAGYYVQVGSGSSIYLFTGTAATNTFASALTAGVLSTVVVTGTCGSNNFSIYVDGVDLTASRATHSPTTSSSSLDLLAYNGGASNFQPGTMTWFGCGPNLLSQAEALNLSRQPWQLFTPLPRRIWVPSAGTGASVSTGVGALTISGLAPTVTQQIAVSTGVGALTITGQAPSASVSGGAAEATPSVGALTITTYAPTVTQQIAIQVNSGALVLSSSAPTVATGTQVSVGSAAMTLAGLAPTITQAIVVTPGPAALTLAAYAPTAELPDKTVSVDVAELIITGYGPTVDGGTVVQTATRGGGHHRKVKQRRYTVTIDDEEFIVASIAEAKKLISAAEEAAKEKADQAIAKVVAAGKKTKRKAIQEAREELRPPVIEIDGAIDLAEEAEARIAEIYDSALAIARNVARRRDEDDDEDVLLLL